MYEPTILKPGFTATTMPDPAVEAQISRNSTSCDLLSMLDEQDTLTDAAQ